MESQDGRCGTAQKEVIKLSSSRHHHHKLTARRLLAMSGPE